jgi:SAM-dependent methyltransferase
MTDDLAQGARVRAAFEGRATSWAAEYDRPDTFRGHSLVARRAEVLELLLPRLSGERVLDLGCGTGEYVAPLLDRGLEVWGLDAAPAMLDRLRRRFPADAHRRLHVVAGAAEQIALPDALFDGVLCAGVLEYSGDWRRALGEIARVLRPGGVAVVTVPNRCSPFNAVDRTVYGLRRVGGRLLDAVGLFAALRGRPRERAIYRHRAFRPGELDRAMARLGLVGEDWRFCGFGSFALNTLVPGAVALSRALMRFRRHRVLGLLGGTYIIQGRKASGAE